MNFMKVKVLGIQSVDYVSRKTGNPVKGVTLHSAFKDAQVEGESVSSIFVSDNLNLKCVAEIRPGMMVDVEYNNRGYVCDLAICSNRLFAFLLSLAVLSWSSQPPCGRFPHFLVRSLCQARQRYRFVITWNTYVLPFSC